MTLFKAYLAISVLLQAYSSKLMQFWAVHLLFTAHSEPMFSMKTCNDFIDDLNLKSSCLSCGIVCNAVELTSNSLHVSLSVRPCCMCLPNFNTNSLKVSCSSVSLRLLMTFMHGNRFWAYHRILYSRICGA